MKKSTVSKTRQGAWGQESTREMCSGFFNTVFHQGFAPHGWTVKAEFYCNILRHLREKIQHKRPELYWNGCMWILKFTCNFGPNNTMVSLFFSHLLELAPCNLFLFSQMKFKLKGRCFDCLAGETCLDNSTWRELTSIAEALRELYRCTRLFPWGWLVLNRTQSLTFWPPLVYVVGKGASAQILIIHMHWWEHLRSCVMVKFTTNFHD